MNCFKNLLVAQPQDSSEQKTKIDRIDSASQILIPSAVSWITLGFGSSASINDFAAAEGAVFYVKHNINFFSGRVIYSQGAQNITLPHEKTFDADSAEGIAARVGLFDVVAGAMLFCGSTAPTAEPASLVAADDKTGLAAALVTAGPAPF